VDVIIGHENDAHHRDRLVRVQRVDGVIRLLGAVRLDETAIHTLGTFTVPLRHVAALQKALAKLAATH